MYLVFRLKFPVLGVEFLENRLNESTDTSAKALYSCEVPSGPLQACNRTALPLILQNYHFLMKKNLVLFICCVGDEKSENFFFTPDKENRNVIRLF
jgi:hypothetical protein